jgi:hypothetical protein
MQRGWTVMDENGVALVTPRDKGHAEQDLRLWYSRKPYTVAEAVLMSAREYDAMQAVINALEDHAVAEIPQPIIDALQTLRAQ